MQVLTRTSSIAATDYLAHQVRYSSSPAWSTMTVTIAGVNEAGAGSAFSSPQIPQQFIEATGEQLISGDAEVSDKSYIFNYAPNISYGGFQGYPLTSGVYVSNNPTPAIYKIDSSKFCFLSDIFTAIPDTSVKKFGSSSAKFTSAESIEVSGFLPKNGVNNNATYTSDAGPGQSAFDFSGDFTIELWVRVDSIGAGDKNLIHKRSAVLGFTGISLMLSDGKPRFKAGDGTRWTVDVMSPTVLGINSWNHIVATRSGQNFQLYINGQSVAQAMSAVTIADTQSSVLKIGSLYNPGGTASLDASGNNAAISYIGDGLTNMKSKFGFYSYMIGSSLNTQKSISVIRTGISEYLTNDFTLEFWVNFVSSDGHLSLIGDPNDSLGNLSPSITVGKTGLIHVNINTGLPSAVSIISSAGLLSTGNNWAHVALVRSGSTISLYLDGNLVGSSSAIGNNAVVSQSSSTLYMGGSQQGIAYIDSIRTSIGIARYISAFAQPQAEFAADIHTSFLLTFEPVQAPTETLDAFVGNIDELRISTGIARYTSAFQVPIVPHVPDANTTLLYHFNKSFEHETSQTEAGMLSLIPAYVDLAGDIPDFRIFNLTSNQEAAVVNLVSNDSANTGSEVLVYDKNRSDSTVKCASTTDRIQTYIPSLLNNITPGEPSPEPVYTELVMVYDEVEKTLTADAIGIGVLDKVEPVVGDRVLIKNQRNSYENGVYLVEQNSFTGKFKLIQQNKVQYFYWVRVGSGATLANTVFYQVSKSVKSLPYSPSVFKN